MNTLLERSYRRADMKTSISQMTGFDGMPEYISIIGGNQCAKVRIDDIVAIEQDGRKLHIVTSFGDYTIFDNINNIVMSLANRAFFRPMKGLIINLDHVKDISGHYVNFYSGQTVTMGRNSITKTRAAYKRYLLRYPPYSLWEPGMNVAERMDEYNAEFNKNIHPNL